MSVAKQIPCVWALEVKHHEVFWRRSHDPWDVLPFLLTLPPPQGAPPGDSQPVLAYQGAMFHHITWGHKHQHVHKQLFWKSTDVKTAEGHFLFTFAGCLWPHFVFYTDNIQRQRVLDSVFRASSLNLSHLHSCWRSRNAALGVLQFTGLWLLLTWVVVLG